MIMAVLLFVVALVFALQVIRTSMDRHEELRSEQMMALQMAEVRQRLVTIARDYNNWTDAWLNISAANWPWVFENYAVTAHNGELIDGALLFGGPLSQPVAWRAGIGPEPQEGFLTAGEMAMVEAGLADQDSVDPDIFLAFIYRDGVPVFLAATRVFPSELTLIQDRPISDLPIAVFTRALSVPMMEEIAGSLTLNNLRWVGSVPDDTPRLMLAAQGVAGRGGLIWVADRPGTQMVSTMWPLLALVALAFSGLAAGAALIARAAANTLIGQESRASAQARTDALTGLPNRLAFTERMQGYDREKSRPIALLYIDLNGFKRINDTIGHDAGDAVVRAFARRLQEVAGRTDFVARIGGDEFVVITECAPGVASDLFALQAQSLGKQLESRQTEVLTIKGFSLTVSAAQGMAIWDGYDLTAAELMRRADLAMYQGKSRRQTELVLYAADMDSMQREDQRIERALRRALTRPEEFSMHYQPIVASATRALIRVEALARWDSAELGRVPPDRFIAVAEQTGLIADVGRLLLRHIAADMARYPALQVSLNVSPVQLLMPGFIAELAEIFGTHGVASDRVEIELTEGVLVSNPDLAAFRLDALHDLGFSTGLDDFGTGFSSIGYLRRMPFDTLKIDRSFLGTGTGDAPNLALIQSIVLLGHSIGKMIVFEGVETEPQALLLASLGCDLLQGYHFSRPVPLAELVDRYPDLAPFAQDGTGTIRLA